jgi:hypothetical protein
MNVNVKTKIRFNGQEYSTPAELPAEARAAYEKAIADKTTAVGNGGITTRLVINGQQFSSPADMPDAERKVYQDAMQLIRDQTGASSQLAGDTRWFSKRQVQLIAIVAALLIGAALVLASRM